MLYIIAFIAGAVIGAVGVLAACDVDLWSEK